MLLEEKMDESQEIQESKLNSSSNSEINGLQFQKIQTYHLYAQLKAKEKEFNRVHEL
jgi:hypothetical protein